MYLILSFISFFLFYQSTKKRRHSATFYLIAALIICTFFTILDISAEFFFLNRPQNTLQYTLRRADFDIRLDERGSAHIEHLLTLQLNPQFIGPSQPITYRFAEEHLLRDLQISINKEELSLEQNHEISCKRQGDFYQLILPPVSLRQDHILLRLSYVVDHILCQNEGYLEYHPIFLNDRSGFRYHKLQGQIHFSFPKMQTALYEIAACSKDLYLNTIKQDSGDAFIYYALTIDDHLPFFNDLTFVPDSLLDFLGINHSFFPDSFNICDTCKMYDPPKSKALSLESFESFEHYAEMYSQLHGQDPLSSDESEHFIKDFSLQTRLRFASDLFEASDKTARLPCHLEESLEDFRQKTKQNNKRFSSLRFAVKYVRLVLRRLFILFFLSLIFFQRLLNKKILRRR